MARPLTPELTNEIAAYMSAGMPLARAATLAGVHRATAKRWMQLGESARPGDEQYAAFREAVERASAKSELKLLMIVRAKAEDGDWKAAAWLLRNVSPDAYASPGTVEEKPSGPAREPVRLFPVPSVPKVATKGKR